MNRHRVQRHARLRILEAHQPLAELFDQTLFARRDIFRRHTDAVAHRFRQQMLHAQEVQARRPHREIVHGKIAPLGSRLAVRHLLGPAGLQETQPLLRIRQINPHLRDVRVLQQVRVQLRRRFRDEHDADVHLAHLG